MEFNPFPRQLAIQNQPLLLSTFSQVIQNGIFLNGQFLQKFEQQLKNYFQVKYAIGVGSGHDALQLAIRALQLKSSDEVLFPINAYPTAFAVCQSGLTPVGIDIDKNGQLNPEDLEQKISPKSKVLIVVHLYGLVGNLTKILALAKKHHLIVIEDCAQSFGTKYQDQLTGTFGHIGCLSFYPTKNLGTLGDGGAIITQSKKINDYLLMARSYGEKMRYESEFISFHSRLPELQAAALTIYFQQFADLAAKRQQAWGWYQEALSNPGMSSLLRLLVSDYHSQAVPHLLVIAATHRNELQLHLQKHGIETLIHYPKTVHQVAAFKKFAFLQTQYPMAEQLQESLLSLPFHPYLSKNEIWAIVRHIREFYET